jgi:hypothetical protein
MPIPNPELNAEPSASNDNPVDNESSAREMRFIWILAVGGSVAVLIAGMIELLGSESTQVLVILQVMLVFGGAMAVGIAVKQRPTKIGLLILASGVCILARFGIPQEWESMRLVAGFGAIVSAIGAGMVALPINCRKIAVSVLVVLHFGGILMAVTAPERQPWLSNIIGVGVYRPYLQFMYLISSYHFTEPGPMRLMWYCIKYKPDQNNAVCIRWFKVPRRTDDISDRLKISYVRRLSLSWELEATIPAEVSDEMKRARMMVRSEHGAPGLDAIPIHPGMRPMETQYRMPSFGVREKVLPSYVRYVANLKENQHDDGMTEIDTIRVYLVEHSVLQPEQWKIGMQPYDPATYRPYFLGEFDTEGSLKNPQDTLLYWLVPILWQPINQDVPGWHTPRTHPDEFIIVDGLRLHTGSDHNGTHQGR